MRRPSTTPRISDLIPALQSSAPGPEDVGAEGASTTEATSYDASKAARQLNVRVPVGLYSDLLRTQAALMVDLGAKPSIQTLLTACLRLGLGDEESLKRAIADGSSGAGRNAAKEGEGA